MSGHRGGAPPGKAKRAKQRPARSHADQPATGGLGAVSVPLDPDDPALTAAADLALASGGYVIADDLGVVLVADLFVVEGIVNGLPPLPETVRLLRGDGRSVYVFRVPPTRWAA